MNPDEDDMDRRSKEFFEQVATQVQTLSDHWTPKLRAFTASVRRNPKETGMPARLTADEVQQIRDLADDLVDDHGWAAMGMDLRQALVDRGVRCGLRPERELAERIVWRLSRPGPIHP